MLSLLISLSSCSKNANMTDLTQYQNEDFIVKAKLSWNSQNISAEIERSGDILKLRIISDDIPEDTFFYFTEDSAFLQTGNAVFPFSPNASPLLSHISDLFSLSAADIWKIERSDLGGVSVYKCESTDNILYVDAYSHLPLKIQNNEITVDIISFSLSK